MGPKVLDLFCGGGGLSSGFIAAGYRVVWGIDNDPAVQRTYERNHPDTEFICADVQELDPRDFTDANVVIGSPPCTKFSVACPHPDHGEGMVLVDAFRSWIDAINPRHWVMENVSPILPYLTPAQYPRRVLLNAADYGVPQVRVRCFSGSFPIPRPTHAKAPVMTLDNRRLRRWVTVRKAISDPAPILIMTDQRGTQTMKGNSPFYDASRRPARTITTVPQRIIMNPEQMVAALVAKHPSLKAIRPPTIPMILRAVGRMNALELDGTNTRPLTVEESAVLQAFPPEFAFCGSQAEQYRMVGNAVPPLLAQRIAESLIGQNT